MGLFGGVEQGVQLAGRVSFEKRGVIYPLTFLSADFPTWLLSGKTMAENLAGCPDLTAGQDVVLPLESPIKSSGHIQILYGNLSPEGSVAKITGKEGLQFTGQVSKGGGGKMEAVCVWPDARLLLTCLWRPWGWQWQRQGHRPGRGFGCINQVDCCSSPPPPGRHPPHTHAHACTHAHMCRLYALTVRRT